MLAHLNLELSLYYKVAFLTGVSGKLNIAVLRLLAVSALDVKRLGYPVLESGGKVVIGHSVRLFNALTLALSSHGVRPQSRALTLDNIGHVHVERQRAAVYERKV